MTALTRRFLGVFAGLALVALAACNIENMGLDKEKDAAARAMFEAFRKGDVSRIQMGAEMQTPEAQAAIPQMIAAVPKGQPTSVKATGWKSNWSMSGVRTENLETTHEWTFPEGVLVVSTVMAREAPEGGQMGPWKLRGLHFKPKEAVAPATPAPATSTPTSAEQPAAASDEGRSFALDEARQDEIGAPTGEADSGGGAGRP